MTNARITLSAEEMAEYTAFKKAQAEKRAKEERKQNLEAYNKLTDELVAATMPTLCNISKKLGETKRGIFDDFKALLDMKNDVMKMTKDGQRSHTFTTSDGKMRLELGFYQLDNYKDTVNDGIALIKEYINGLVKDSETQALVDMVLKLLSKDNKGNLKASRVLQLRNLADKVNDERFSEGVEIIMNAYAPVRSKQFIRAFEKNDKNEWESVPLSITDVKSTNQ